MSDTSSFDLVVIHQVLHYLDDPARAIREAAGRLGVGYIPLGDLGERDEMSAKGLFEHSGVAGHPGDRGMKEISDRILGAIK